MSVKLSHRDKIYWPREKIAKGELLDYYADVGKVMLRYLKNRPLAMHRFPNGIQGESFYQKDVQDVPDFVRTALVSHANRKVRYILVQNLKTLLYVANLGSIELHLFHSTIQHLDKPNYMVLDLDPESISFEAVIDVALLLHDLLKKRKIPNFCKTSGGRGLHIYVPLKGKYSYEEVLGYAKAFAHLAREELPNVISLEKNPARRKRKVYIDTLRNAKGQLTVAPYSVRGFPGATVSTPLSWEEVKQGLSPKSFTLKNVPKRLAEKGDLFQGVLGRGANLKEI